MPIHHAVLGMLAEGPSYGYELKSSFEIAVGPQWGELNIGHLYQVLDRLVRDGLVTRREVVQRDRPDKVVYRLTRAGRIELGRWLSEPIARRGGYRDDFFLKLFVASRLGPDHVGEAARVQREAYLAELSTLADLKREHRREPLVALLVEAAILHTTANLRVAELAEERAAQIAQAPRAGAGEALAAADEVGA
ncbi:MAG TPA: helix-turn-helix transcriptional regulator [Actinomycetota bacterium]